METVNIGILGLGTVGCGVVNLIIDNQAELQEKLGKNLVVSHALVNDLNKDRACNTKDIILTTNPADIIENKNIDIVVEVLGGVDKAKDLTKQVLSNGKPLVTANKALIAENLGILFDMASEKKTPLLFEAAVAGGIPIIKAIREGLSANKINKIVGIINGTCNYILTKMFQDKLGFEECLKEAQDLGYAESSPSFDIDGIDAYHKIFILACLGFGKKLQLDLSKAEGIADIELLDLQYADRLGFTIKHLAVANRTQNGVSIKVAPTLVLNESILSEVKDVMNAVLIEASPIGQTFFYGPGAGGGATASAVVADIVDIIRQNKVPNYGYFKEPIENTICTEDFLEYAYYLRIGLKDKPGALASLTKVLEDSDISIDQIVQSGAKGNDFAQVVIVTYPILEKQLNKAIDMIEKSSVVNGKVKKLRVEKL